MRCLIGIDDENLIEEVKGYLDKIDRIIYVEATSDLETVQKMLTENTYDFMIASCCQHKDYSQKLLGWIRVKKINIEVIYATRYNDSSHIQQAFRYGVCDYLLLPVDFDRFSMAINRAIEKILFMNSQNKFNQNEIDDYLSLFNSAGQNTKPVQTAGINNSTFSVIQDYIKKANKPFTADQIAQEINLSRITARRYLEKLVEEDELDVGLEYGKIGRPQKIYMKKK